MGVADRVRRTQAKRQREALEGNSPTDSQGQSSLVLVDPPHIARMKGVMYALRGMIEENNDGSGLARFAFLMTTLSEELAEELVEYDEIAIRAFMFQIGEVISWIGHGDNERLPDAVRVFAEMVQPSRVENANPTHDNETPDAIIPGNSLVAGMDSESRMQEVRP